MDRYFGFSTQLFQIRAPESLQLDLVTAADQHQVARARAEAAAVAADKINEGVQSFVGDCVATVIASNIHYPTDTSLLWESYRVLVRLLRAVRKKDATFCPHRFHAKKVKRDLVYVGRYMRSRSMRRQRELKRRLRNTPN